MNEKLKWFKTQLSLAPRLLGVVILFPLLDIGLTVAIASAFGGTADASGLSIGIFFILGLPVISIIKFSEASKLWSENHFRKAVKVHAQGLFALTILSGILLFYIKPIAAHFILDEKSSYYIMLLDFSLLFFFIIRSIVAYRTIQSPHSKSLITWDDFMGFMFDDK